MFVIQYFFHIIQNLSDTLPPISTAQPSDGIDVSPPGTSNTIDTSPGGETAPMLASQKPTSKDLSPADQTPSSVKDASTNIHPLENIPAKTELDSDCPANAQSSKAKWSFDNNGECPAVKYPVLIEQFDNFPFEVETTGIVLSEPPLGLILTTTITNSGNLEVITEGPEGLIETELNYREDGVIEVTIVLYNH